MLRCCSLRGVVQMMALVMATVYCGLVPYARASTAGAFAVDHQDVPDCKVLDAVRSIARSSLDTKLARVRELIEIDQSENTSLPQLSALWRALPGGVDAEQELDLLLSVPLGTFGKRQAEDAVRLNQRKSSMDARVREAAILRGTLELYYDIAETTRILRKYGNTSRVWQRTLVMLEQVNNEGLERNLLEITLALEYETLQRELRELTRRRDKLTRGFREITGLDYYGQAQSGLFSALLRPRSSSVFRKSLRLIHLHGVQLWKDALSGVQLQGGLTALWTPAQSRMGYYIGINYAPLSPGALNSLRSQAQAHELEWTAIQGMHDSNLVALKRRRSEMFAAKQRLEKAQMANQAQRALENRMLEKEPTELSLSYLTQRVNLIRSMHDRDAQESNFVQDVGRSRLEYLESLAVVVGLNGLVCETLAGGAGRENGDLLTRSGTLLNRFVGHSRNGGL